MWYLGPRPHREFSAEKLPVGPPVSDDPQESSTTPSATSADFSRIPLGSGHGLAPEMRRRLEARLGEDLGTVRVHTGPEASRAARDLGAVAYTSGESIVLGGKGDAADE